MSSFVAVYLRQWRWCTAMEDSLNKSLFEDMAVMENKKGLGHQFLLVLSLVVQCEVQKLKEK